MGPTRLILVFLVSCAALLAGECAPSIRIVQDSKKGTVLVNGTDKAVVAYVLFDPGVKSNDGTPTRTYSGVFTSGDSLQGKRSMNIRKQGTEAGRVAIDYVSFMDGSRCGMAATPEAKRLIAR